MSIVVTGATGQLGGLVVDHLIRRGVEPPEIVAAGRDPGRLAALAGKGVRTAAIDLDEPTTLDAPFADADKLLLISGNDVGRRRTQHLDAVAAAERAGVPHLLYTSVLMADRTTLVLAPDHKATEEAITAAGIPATILRNGWYTENYQQQLHQARGSGVVLSSAAEGRVASATRDDYAEAIAAALTGDGHEGAVYELSGDTAWSFRELAAAFGEVLGRDVAYASVSPEEHLRILTDAGLDEGTAQFVVALDGNIRDGELALTTGDLARLAGRPSTPLVEAVRQML